MLLGSRRRWRAPARKAVWWCAEWFYAELLAYPGATGEFVERFLGDTRILVEFDFSREVWLAAGGCFAAYCHRRRRSGGSESKRLLADFLVGAQRPVAE